LGLRSEKVFAGDVQETEKTENYKPVLSSERAPQDEQQSNFPTKERKK
jgi:hypothetical protein